MTTCDNTRQILVTYLLDYVLIILCIGAFSALDFVEPYHQQFSLGDISIQQLYATKERVPPAEAAVVAILIPIACMTLWCLILEGRTFTRRKVNIAGRLWEINMSVLGLLLSVGLALVTTNIFKVTVGRPRPDFIDRCQPQVAASSADSSFVLSNYTLCTQSDHRILRDGFRSFPSGHSSTAFSGLGYLAFWIAGKVRVLDGNGHIWKIALIAIPLLAASLIAISRIMDERHHPFDVLFGSALGLITSWASYRQYFPPLRLSGIAYSVRQSILSNVDYRPADEEEEFNLPGQSLPSDSISPVLSHMQGSLSSRHNDYNEESGTAHYK